MSTIKANAFKDTGNNNWHPARAWVNFTGVGSVSIRDDGSVSSITDNSTGNYTTNLQFTQSNSSYCCNFSATDSGSGSSQTNNYAYGTWKRGSTAVVYATGTIRIGMGYAANTSYYDQSHVNISIVGD